MIETSASMTADQIVVQTIRDLADYIESAKHEIASIRPQDIGDSHIPEATDELDAVIAATEEATDAILEGAERLMEVAETVDDPARSELVEIGTAIFEASNFQDITGQRIRKVVGTLSHIEQTIAAMMRIIPSEFVGEERVRKPGPCDSAENGEFDESALLNGPQLPNAAVDQDEIDRLLAEFD